MPKLEQLIVSQKNNLKTQLTNKNHSIILQEKKLKP